MLRKLLLFLFLSAPLFAQTNTFPFMNSGTEAQKPATCTVPSFYSATDSGNLYSCANGLWFLVGGSSTPIATTTLAASVSPSTLNFGTVQNNTSSQPQIVTISNTGSATLAVLGAAFSSGAKFSSVNLAACNGALPSGAACSLLILYTPTAGISDSDTLTFTTSAPTDPQNPLTVSLSGSGTASPTFPVTIAGFGLGSGLVSDGASLNCHFTAGKPDTTGANTQCSENYVSGTSVTLTATADSGSLFGTFAGAGLTSSPATLTVTQAQTISTTFNLAPVNNNLTLAFTGQGSGGIVSDVSTANGIFNCNGVAGVASSGGAQGCGPGSLPQGTVITLTETPLTNNTFVGWVGAPGCTTASTCVVTLNADQTVTANFASTTTIPITLVQTTTNCTTSGTTSVCPWASAQSAGDFLVIGIGIPDATTTISSVVDSKSNTYTQVPTISPKVGTSLTQALYYAQNIVASAAGANSTTVTYSSSVASAIVGTSLDSNHSLSTANSYTTASVTLTTNNLILVTFWAQLNSGNGPGAISTVTDTGCSLTWQLVLAKDFNSTQGSGTTTRIETWRTLGNGNSCTVKATWGTSPTARGASISKFSGVDTSGSNGSGAIGITASNKGSGNTNCTVTMGTFGSASNGTYGACGTGGGTNRTAGTGMTLLGADGDISDEWAAGNVSPVAETLNSNQAWGIIGVEIKASGGAGRRDVRALEYGGILQSGSPIDVSAAAVGTSATSAPGSMTTTVANDTVVDFNLSNQSVNTPATSFTQRVKNTFGDDAEDIEGAATGAYNPSVTLSASGNWVASQVSFKPQTTQAPTVFSATVNVVGTGSGVVTSNTGNPLINCPGTACSSQVTAQSSITFTAQANPGSVFVQWTGITGCSTSATCIVPSITANQNVSATFNLSGKTAYFVNGSTGSDSNDGLAASVGGGHGPWKTFSKAMNAVKIGPSGTVVSFAPFNYAESVTLPQGGASFARLSFVCNTPWTVGGSNCKMTQINTYLVNNVDIGAPGQLGFELTNPGGQVVLNNVANSCNTSSGACNVGNNIHYFGNYIHDVSSGVCNFSGAILAGQHTRQQTDFEAVGNLVDFVGNFPSTTCSGMHGIYVVNPGAIITNNVILRVAGGAIQYYDEACSGVVSNNTLLNGHFGIISYGSNGCTAGLNTYANNIIDNMTGAAFYNGFSSAGDCTSGRNSLFSNNILNGNGAQWQQPQPSCEIRQGTLSESPTSTFVNYTGDKTGNYQLKSTSIAINGGTGQCVTGGQNPCVPSIDFLNVSRPQRQTFDIGAYELP